MNGTPVANSSPFAFLTGVHNRILTDYVQCLYQACAVFRFPAKYLEYSERELRLSIEEAEIDIRAMYARRSATFGIAEGKMAGVLAYRLARFKIVHIYEEGWQHLSQNGHMIQELAALFLVKQLFLYNRIVSEGAILEIAYQLSRRHANQETLGAFFHVLPYGPAVR